MLFGVGVGALLAVTAVAVNDSLNARLRKQPSVPGFAWDDGRYPPVANPPTPYNEGESSCGFTPAFRELSPGALPRIGVIAVGFSVLEKAFKSRGPSDFRLGFMYRHTSRDPAVKCEAPVVWRQAMGPPNTVFGGVIPGVYSEEGDVLGPTMLAAAIMIGTGERALEIAWAMQVKERTTMLATGTIDISGNILGDGSTPLSDLARFPQGLPVLGPPPKFDPSIGS